jgi:G3E family GTPase
MTVLDILSRHREAEAVFKAWDSRAGACICCQALFDTVQQVADRYGLDLDRLMAEINAVVYPTDSVLED